MPTTALSETAETVRAFLAELEFQKREAAAFKHQMEVNNSYAQCYESALKKIATLCGYVPDASCRGCPEDVDSRAIRLVTELINSKNYDRPARTG